ARFKLTRSPVAPRPKRIPTRRLDVLPPCRSALSATSHEKNNTEDPSSRAADKHKLAQRRAIRQFGCLWWSCIGHKQCHISLAVSRQQHHHSLPQQHYLQPIRCRRPMPHPFPYFPTPNRSRHLRSRRELCQRQRYEPWSDWPPRQGIGTLSPAALKTDSTDHLFGRPHKTSPYQA